MQCVSHICYLRPQYTPHRPPLGLNNFSILVRFLIPVRQLPSEVSPSPGPYVPARLSYEQLSDDPRQIQRGRSQIRKISLYLITRQSNINPDGYVLILS